MRSDDLAAKVIEQLVGSIKNFENKMVDDLIVGNAVPEAEQGMQMGRYISLLALSKEVPGMIINRYCGSGLEAIHLACARIHAGTANCIIAGGTESSRNQTIDTDEGPRKETSLKVLSKLKPAFKVMGQVTAGNSSQMSDGAAFVLVMSKKMVKELKLEPLARMVSYATAGVEPRIMGIGPAKAVPKALFQAGLKLNQIEQIELNEAFAAQALSVIKALEIDKKIVNVNGGAVALGHPLGMTGAKLSIKLINEMKRRNQKYGIVTACVGGGQGVCGVFENLIL